MTVAPEDAARLRAVSREERDRVIREIYGKGDAGIREIARVVGLSHTQVARIVRA